MISFSSSAFVNLVLFVHCFINLIYRYSGGWIRSLLRENIFHQWIGLYHIQSTQRFAIVPYYLCLRHNLLLGSLTILIVRETEKGMEKKERKKQKEMQTISRIFTNMALLHKKQQVVPVFPSIALICYSYFI